LGIYVKKCALSNGYIKLKNWGVGTPPLSGKMRVRSKMLLNVIKTIIIFSPDFRRKALDFLPNLLRKKLLIFPLIFNTKSPGKILIFLEKPLVSKIWIS
jgi:hypothetical protein